MNCVKTPNTQPAALSTLESLSKIMNKSSPIDCSQGFTKHAYF